MIRAPRPICPMCDETGIHPDVDDCLTALRRARAELDRVSGGRCAVLLERHQLAMRVTARWIAYTKAVGLWSSARGQMDAQWRSVV